MKAVGTRYLILVIGILTFCISPLVSSSVSAADTQVQVLVGDMCPNIPGNQPTLPSGMQFDGEGNCFTPTPPPPPDTCPNLNGRQEAIPEGYYRNRNGNCVPQTRPPTDVCPNLDATQNSVPYGMQTASNGDCIWPPNDLCPNIPGPQDPMPDGMKYDGSGNCHTPVTNTPTTTEKPHRPTRSSAIFDPLPYYLIAALGFVALLLLLQTIRESFVTRGIIILFKRKKRATELIDRLIALLMQYLKNTLDAMVASPLTSSPLSDTTRTIQTNIVSVIGHQPESNADSPDDFSRAGIHVKTLLSPLFLTPVILTIAAVVTANILLGNSAPISFGVQHILLQAFALFMASAFLFLVLRARHIRHVQHEHTEQLIKRTVALYATREHFIHSIYIVLDVGLADISEQKLDESSEGFQTYYKQLLSINEKLRHLYAQDGTAKPDDTAIMNDYLELEKIIQSYLDKNAITSHEATS